MAFVLSRHFGHGYYYFGCPKPFVWQAWCLHFSTFGSILAARGHHWGPWEQQEGHLGVQNQVTESTPCVIGVAVGKR